MAISQDSPKPDLGSLRIHDDQRGKSGTRKRIVYAAIPVILFGAIVGGAFALRNQKPVVQAATVAKPDTGGPQTALNASGYVTPRQRATIAAKITGRVTAVYFDEGTRVASYSQRWTTPTISGPSIPPRRTAIPPRPPSRISKCSFDMLKWN